jgi:hypothetical protein
MIILTSLAIGTGDSFLIRNGDESYLIDSGGNQKSILKLIPKRINLAICTHNDSDHCKGFIGILKSEKHTIDEIWLPGTWSAIIDYVKKYSYNRISSRMNFGDINLTNIDSNNILRNILQDTDQDIDDFTDDLAFIRDIEDDLYWHYPTLHLNPSDLNSSEKIRFNIKRILEIAILAYERGVAIRWFSPESSDNSVFNNFRPVNCKRLQKTKKIRDDRFDYFLQLAYLTSENEYSLVFEYHINDIPRILFTADSIPNSNFYTEQIIVTAPHHGSDSNRQAYENIKGNDIIWVRSDRPSFKRPCKKFLDLSNKYCLSCTKNYPIKSKKISFKYNNRQWEHLEGQRCQC